MRNLFPIFCFLTLGLTACTGCNKKDTTPVCTGSDCTPPVVPVTPAPDAGVTPVTPSDTLSQTLSGEGWELVVPEGYDTTILQDEEQPDVLVVNEEEHSIVLLIKEPFVGSTPAYVINAVRGVAEAGATLNASKQVELNGNKYVLLDSNKEGSRVWTWLTVNNGFGYSLSCGGPETEDHHETLCSEVANSLKLH